MKEGEHYVLIQSNAITLFIPSSSPLNPPLLNPRTKFSFGVCDELCTAVQVNLPASTGFHFTTEVTIIGIVFIDTNAKKRRRRLKSVPCSRAAQDAAHYGYFAAN